MENVFFMLAQAKTEPTTGNPIVMLVFMVVFIIFFYFVVIRPQNKRKKEMEKMINELKKGDKVVTIGGVHGKVVSVKDDVVVLKVDDNAEITFEKSAIARVNNPVLNNASKDSKETKKIEDNLENNKSENNNN